MVFGNTEFNPIVEKFIINIQKINQKELKKEEFKLEITKIRFTKKDSEKIIEFFDKVGVIQNNGKKIIIK